MYWDYELAYRRLRTDPVLDAVIKTTGRLSAIEERDLYISLLHSVVSQQLSVKAAATIWTRFLNRFHNGKPEAHSLIQMKDEELRACGLSFAKAAYLRNVAAFHLEGQLEHGKLKVKSDEELVLHLSSIKGVGRWTAEMILIFNLHRPDVMPYDDIGIQNSIRDLYGLNGDKTVLKKEIEYLGRQWMPYRSLACRHLWKIRDLAM